MEHKMTEMGIRIEFCSIAQNPKTSDEEKFQMLSVFFEKNKNSQCFTALFSLTKATTEGDTNAWVRKVLNYVSGCAQLGMDISQDSLELLLVSMQKVFIVSIHTYVKNNTLGSRRDQVCGRFPWCGDKCWRFHHKQTVSHDAYCGRKFFKRFQSKLEQEGRNIFAELESSVRPSLCFCSGMARK